MKVTLELGFRRIDKDLVGKKSGKGHLPKGEKKCWHAVLVGIPGQSNWSGSWV